MNIFNNFKIFLIKRKFKKNVFFSDYNSCTFSYHARCYKSQDNCIKIGKHCYIDSILISNFHGIIEIGDNCFLGPSSIIMCKNKVKIGNGVILAGDSIIMDNNNHPVSLEYRKKMVLCDSYIDDPMWSWMDAESKPVIIEDNVWIGRDVRILKGVTIGYGSIIGLGSIVTKDVPPMTIVGGNPARIIKEIDNGEN